MPLPVWYAHRMLVLVLSAVLSAAPDGGATPIEAQARQVVRWFDEQRADALTPRLSAPLQKALPPEKLQALMKSLVSAEGPSVNVERTPGESSERAGTFTVTTQRGARWVLSLTTDGAGTIIGLSLTPPKKPDPPVVKAPPLAQLPFAGAWTVFWGGDRLEVNQHVTVPSQRRAVDAIIVDDAGVSHRGDGKTNPDFYAWGQPLFAVADGTVETVVDGVPENPPGEMNRFFVPGNMVVLRHGDALFSVYAHLVPASSPLKVGQRVKAGALVGKVGNSGNSSEAHLHFQLQDGPRFEQSWGLEPVFTNVRVTRDGGTTVEPAYSWLKGDVVFAPQPRRR